MKKLLTIILIIALLPINILAQDAFTMLGPIIEYKKDESSKTFAFRPLFYYEADYELKFRSLVSDG